jgi:hypothetical protein
MSVVKNINNVTRDDKMAPFTSTALPDPEPGRNYPPWELTLADFWQRQQVYLR